MDKHKQLPADKAAKLTNCEEPRLLQLAEIANAHFQTMSAFCHNKNNRLWSQKCLLPVVLYLLRVLSTPVTTKCAISADETPGGNGLPWLVLYCRLNLMGSAVMLGKCTTLLMGSFFMKGNTALSLKAASASPCFTWVLSSNCRGTSVLIHGVKWLLAPCVWYAVVQQGVSHSKV